MIASHHFLFNPSLSSIVLWKIEGTREFNHLIESNRFPSFLQPIKLGGGYSITVLERKNRPPACLRPAARILFGVACVYSLNLVSRTVTCVKLSPLRQSAIESRNVL